MTTLLDTIGNTPLVTLTSLTRDLPWPVLVKCEHLNPGGSVKDRIAKAIIEDAEARGVLSPGDTLVEATAGNTGIGLALVAAARGYHLVCVMPDKMSEDKRLALRTLGAEVIVTPNAPPSDPNNFQNVAKQVARARDAFLTDQFNNPANPRVHAETTAREILEQTGGDIAAFVSGAGTGGTLSGVGRTLKDHNPDIQIVLADPRGSSLAHLINDGILGPSGPYDVEGIGSSVLHTNLHLDVIDSAVTISDDASFATTRRLICEEGLLVGGSSGTNVAAALQLAAREDTGGPVVTLVTDSWDRYRAQHWMRIWGGIS